MLGDGLSTLRRALPPPEASGLLAIPGYAIEDLLNIYLGTLRGATEVAVKLQDLPGAELDLLHRPPDLPPAAPAALPDSPPSPAVDGQVSALEELHQPEEIVAGYRRQPVFLRRP